MRNRLSDTFGGSVLVPALEAIDVWIGERTHLYDATARARYGTGFGLRFDLAGVRAELPRLLFDSDAEHATAVLTGLFHHPSNL
jgi:hypothetical protein